MSESPANQPDADINHLMNYHPFFTRTDFDEERLIYFYNPVESLLQIGPTCGLVSLVQAKRFMHPDSESLNVNDLLVEAQRIRLTNNGEMFSANGVEQLARDVLELNATTLTCLESNRTSIIENLYNDAAILIPYDTDRNHEPELKGGTCAHWCICTGFGFKVKLDELSGRILDKLQENEDGPFVNLQDVELNSEDLLVLLDSSTDLSLFCKQGKSKLLKVFDFDRLVESNKNLFSVSDKLDASYIVPEEGIGQSLCDKFVLIT